MRHGALFRAGRPPFIHRSKKPWLSHAACDIHHDTHFVPIEPLAMKNGPSGMFLGHAGRWLFFVVIPRQKFFAWLLLNLKLNTKYHMIKKNFYVEFMNCCLCDICPEETLMHLLFGCTFSQSFWWALAIDWNTYFHLHQMITDAKTRYNLSFMMEIIITGCWSL